MLPVTWFFEGTRVFSFLQCTVYSAQLAERATLNIQPGCRRAHGHIGVAPICSPRNVSETIVPMSSHPESPTQEVLAGLVERVTFHNAENGFASCGRKRVGTATSLRWSDTPQQLPLANG